MAPTQASNSKSNSKAQHKVQSKAKVQKGALPMHTNKTNGTTTSKTKTGTSTTTLDRTNITGAATTSTSTLVGATKTTSAAKTTNVNANTNTSASVSVALATDRESLPPVESPTTKDDEMFMRITTHGKLRGWVGVGLKFLTESDDPSCSRRITLHTLPTCIPSSILSPSSFPSTSSSTTSNPTTSAPERINPPKPSSSLLTTPRLISTAEILKREYIKHLEEKKSTRLKGLWQYNEVGTVEGLGYVVEPADEGKGKGKGKGKAKEGEEGEKETDEKEKERRAREIVSALGGKHHPRQTQTPYMRITLSLAERPELVGRATPQQPIIRKLSKSAKVRAKKREKKMRGASASASANVNVNADAAGVSGAGAADIATAGREEGGEQGEMDVDA